MIGVGVYDAAFYFATFFIFGVLLASLNATGLETFFIFLLIASFLSLSAYLNILKNFGQAKIFWIAGMSVFVILGFFYFFFYSERQEKSVNAIFGEKIGFQAVVSEYPKRGEYQDLVLSLLPPYAGKISARLPLYPEFDYGDALNAEGIINEIPSDGYGRYLDKNGISGTIGFPKAEAYARGKGSRAKSFLFSVKNGIIRSFENNLPFEEANLLAGLTLGDDSGFRKEDKEKMKKSGTTHLVALSGYNISILALWTMSFFSAFLRRRHSFFAAIIVIFGFVLMTGGEASVVRAAIMGSILLFAGEAGRVYSVRNAIVVAAFFMILANPKVLAFDAGFQLSFISFLGIAYLAPAVKKFFKAKKEPGFLLWRENFWATFSAQSAVFPVLILSFGNFSLLSLVSNVLVLGFIPLTMELGFLLGFLDAVSSGISAVLAPLAHIFLFYETAVIDLFGSIEIFSVSSASIAFAAIYYFFLTAFILWINGKKEVKLENEAG